MVIGVLGVGTVGSAVADNIETKGITVRRSDPDKGFNDNLSDCDLIFVCVWDGGDGESLERAVWQVAGIGAVVVIKTTAMPGTTERISKETGIGRIIYNPEFLSEATAHEDFAHPDKQVIGGWDMGSIGLLVKVLSLFGGEFHIMTPTEAEITKLAVNTLYASKVTIANEIYEICEKHCSDYDRVRTALESDRFIAPNHLDVHHGGYRGFGGKCLPKDIKMLFGAGCGVGYVAKTIGKVISENEQRNPQTGYGDVQRLAPDSALCRIREMGG